MSEYINRYVCNDDVATMNAWQISISNLATWVVQQRNPMLRGMPLQELTREITYAIESRVYRSVLGAAPQDYVSGAAPWPALRSMIDPHALHGVSAGSEQSRNDSLKSLFSRWAEEMGSDLDIWCKEDGYLHWLADKDRILRYATTKADGSLKLRATVETHARALSCLCEAQQLLELKKEYAEALEAMALDAPVPDDRRMTPEQLTALYGQIEAMRTAALPCQNIKPCIEYLLVALHYGDAPGTLQPQRNDMRSFKFKGPGTDKAQDNFITLTEGGATLTLTRTNKPGRGEARPAQTIDLGKNPKLIEFLHAYKPFAEALRIEREPYLLTTAKGQAISQTNLTSRMHHMWKNTLSPKLGFMASGCNQARRAAVDTARLKHGKRKMSESELAEEREQCRQRGHSAATAEKCY
jgi:hypothetical protein